VKFKLWIIQKVFMKMQKYV